MSFRQLDLPADQVADKTVRRALIDAVFERTHTGAGRGQRSARKARKVGEAPGVKVVTDGASPEVLHALAARLEWVRANQFSNFQRFVSRAGCWMLDLR